VHVDAQEIASIGPGLLVLLGVAPRDDEQTAERLAAKIRALRVFADEEGRMNDPLGEREILCVSQFTLYGETRRGNRPSFTGAAPREHAQPLYEHFCTAANAKRGIFGAHMRVELVGDGPVTLILEA
jgi:D-aminoacyl-tRNA deacylase